MPRLKVIGFPIIVIVLLLAHVSDTFSQSPTRRRRVKKENLSIFEIYFDGGYSVFGMSPADDALNNGASFLADTLEFDMFQYINNVDVYRNRTDFKSVRTMGGGFNININQNIGVGLKIQFAQQEAVQSDVIYESDMLNDPGFGSLVLLDRASTVSSNHLYTCAPVIIKAFYKMTPIAAMPGMELTVGGGPGIYTTSIEIFNLFDEDYLNYPPELGVLEYLENFLRYKDRYVAKPIGLYLFGGVSFRGSQAVTLSLEGEYNFVPETTIDTNGWGAPDNFEHTYGINSNTQTQEDYMPFFNNYRPTKMNISSFRLSAALKFSF